MFKFLEIQTLNRRILMHKIKVYFKDLKIGELSFINGFYLFETNKINIKKAKNKAYPLFLFGLENDFSSKELPECFESMIPSDENIDLNVLANIEANDEPFIKLLKIASLNLSYDDLGVKL